MERFDNKATFENALKKGINFFLGAGFSVFAKDKNGEGLMIGSDLLAGIKKKFEISGNYSLPQIATILESKNRQEFYIYLKEKFTVGDYDLRYNCLHKFKVNSFYTTNIDDLVFKIYENCKDKYLNDISHEGSKYNEPASIDYSALHGCVKFQDRKLIFDVSSLNNAYSNSPRIWNYLAQGLEKSPTVFWGYGLNDAGVIQAMTSNLALKSALKDMWIILTPDNKTNADYFEALGLKIIITDTDSFLNYLNALHIDSRVYSENETSDEIEYLFSKNFVPNPNSGLVNNPIKGFFMGDPPSWSNIFGGQIYKTSHFSKIQEMIFSKQNAIILGGSVTGKTTLMMQLAAYTDFDGYKLVFDNLSERNANLIKEVFRNKRLCLFVDNLSASVEGFSLLSSLTNIMLLGFDRTHSYGIVSHLINEGDFQIYNITQLTDHDIQGIYDILPIDQRQAKLSKSNNTSYEKDNIFEFIARNVKYPTIERRFADALKDLEDKDSLLSEFLILLSYAHTAKIPVSFDMLFSYFQDDVNNYSDIYLMRDRLVDLVKDYSGSLYVEGDQDYFYPRSLICAETILKVANRLTVKKVLNKTLVNVPSAQIPFYSTFRRFAFDKNLTIRVFEDWREGMRYYEDAYEYDFRNPYVLQQGALFLSHKKKFTEAFHWIDKAITQSKDRYFSIRNSHAIILFEANINSKEETTEVRKQLDKSMEILERCYNDDKRRVFHVIRYAEQTKEYSKRYFDDKTKHYIGTAINWLKLEAEQNKWNYELRKLLSEISSIAI